MKGYYSQLVFLIKRLLGLLVVYQLGRLAFYLINFAIFKSAGFFEIVTAFIAGLRFDISIILILNVLFIIPHLIPGKLFYRRGTQLYLKIIFFIVNIPATILNCIDLEYFKFQGKRTTADFFHLFTMGDDMKNTVPQMIKDFWYIALLLLFLIFLSFLFYNSVKIHKPSTEEKPGFKSLLILLPAMLIFFLGARGGVQYKPLNIMAAARFTTPQLVPLVLNTPFTVFKSLGKEVLEQKNYMSEAEALHYFNRIHQYKKNIPFKKLNVVIIILESFSSEYIGSLNNGIGYTPFLDSLMKESIVFTNAYANAKKSIDGIPAVLASLPTLMTTSYISSPYNSNKLRSIAGILKSEDYSSAFFHGGNNGTMGFDNFTLLSGFDHYYGRKEYPGKEYDGQWGIFDENFYYYFVSKCSEMKQPFVNAFFSLSSHHPYTIPEYLKNKFPKGVLPIHESIGYADYALGCFFREAKKTSWFNNTLFVITADHTGPSNIPYYLTKAGMFRVPIIFYQPGSKVHYRSDRVTQQVAIVPGILDYLNYNLPFVAFGNSMFDSTAKSFAINYPGDVYQLFDDSHLLQYDGNETVGWYDYKSDIYLFKNIQAPADSEQQLLTHTLQSVLQQFNSTLIKNEMVLPGQ